MSITFTLVALYVSGFGCSGYFISFNTLLLHFRLGEWFGFSGLFVLLVVWLAGSIARLVTSSFQLMFKHNCLVQKLFHLNIMMNFKSVHDVSV